ncbi:cytochrome P450 [Cyathus striatus]|nr:cytochrome P450 [Cyathus striatus]
MAENIILTFSLLSLAIAATTVGYSLSKKRNPLPPGPKGLPFLGNIQDLPKTRPWETFAKWGDIYGGIIHVTAFGKSMIILNDSDTALEMLEKKGKIYSDRPTLVLAGEIIGWDEGPALIPFDRNGKFSEFRRYYNQYIGSRGKVVESFSDMIHAGAQGFVKRLLETPNNWSRHVKMYAASNGLMIGYGHKLDHEDDALLDIVSTAVNEFSELTVNGAYLVDIFPILQYVPAWFPGAGWKRKVPQFRANLNRMMEAPFEWAQQQLMNGIENPGFTHDALANNDRLTPQEVRRIMVMASTFYGGGTDTTIGGIQCFFLAMVLFPSAQVKAQAEIDAVVGSGRLPTLRDRPRLPYVEALYWEVLRYYPYVPLAIPHVVREDDIHGGYFIPKGAMIIPNVWRFMKDERKYRNPGSFSPERFLSSDGHTPEEDPRNFVFGFGRRYCGVCPGRHLGDATMWTAMTSVLAAFTLSPIVKDGKPVTPKPHFRDGTIATLESFECMIKSRSIAMESLIRSV